MICLIFIHFRQHVCVKEWENCAPCVTWPICHDEELWMRYGGRLGDKRVLLEVCFTNQSHFLLKKATNIKWRINIDASQFHRQKRTFKVCVILRYEWDIHMYPHGKSFGFISPFPPAGKTVIDKSAQRGCSFCSYSCSRPWVKFTLGKITPLVCTFATNMDIYVW